MAIEDKLQHFEQQVMQPKLNDSLLAMERYYEANKDKLAQSLLESLSKLCQKVIVMQEAETKGRLGYITFSMLRTELLDNRALYLAEAMDANWFFDVIPCSMKVDMGWAFHRWFELGEQLERDILAYQGTIIKPQVEQLMLKAAVHYHQYVIRLARYACTQVDKLPQWAYVNRNEEFEIRVGEYLDLSEIVLRIDKLAKDEGAVRVELEQNEEAAYSYQVLRNLDLSEGTYNNQDVRYTDFSGSNLSHSQMIASVAVGASFQGCHMDKVNLCASILYEADFSGASLRGALFRFSEGGSGLANETAWEMPGFEPMNFSGADLTGADFEQANLSGAVFAGARLDGVNFNHANLQGAVFSAQDEVYLVGLSEQQRSQIVWQE